MIPPFIFSYTDEQWRKVKGVVSDRLGRDADQIELTRTVGNVTGVQSLRYCIESAAMLHILGSAVASQTPGHKARIKRLTALRDRAKDLYADIFDALAPSVIIEDMAYCPIKYDVDSVNEIERAIAALVDVIDASIAVQRPQQTANTRKAGRNHFWSKALATWTAIGGKETGRAAAEFLVAVAQPVF